LEIHLLKKKTLKRLSRAQMLGTSSKNKPTVLILRLAQVVASYQEEKSKESPCPELSSKSQSS